MSTRIESGRKAKLDGHKKEDALSKKLTEINGSLYYTDGGNKTKRDIINEDLRLWFNQFFGLPRSGREGRLTKSEIDDDLNQLALDWFNNNKMGVFDVIVRHGAYKIDGQIKKGDAINQVVWYDKKKDKIENQVSVEYLSNLVEGGKWIMNETTLHFIDGNDNKMFHLQMKGSGGLSQKNSMQFHIYKVC